MDVFAKVSEILADEAYDVEGMTPDTTFEALGVDSLGVADLVIRLEEELDVGELDLDQMEQKITTIGELVAFIETKIG